MKKSYQLFLTRPRFWFFALFVGWTAGFANLSPVSGQVSITTLGVPSVQSFNSLPSSGSATWTNNSTIPGWFHARTGTGTTIVANDGSSNAGNLYSYGAGTATERALGALNSGNAAIGNMFWGVRLQNNSGATITSLQITYTGEQWRNSAAAAQTISFSYLVGSPTVTGSLAEFQMMGTPIPPLDFTSPITGGTAGALDGNLAANRVTLSFTINALNIPNGTEVMLRWSDPDHTGADHGLSIDDFSVTAQANTAASVSLSGRVVNQSGSGIPKATVSITDSSGVERRTITNPFGFYNLSNLPAGETVVVSVSHKQHTFTPRVLSVEDNIANLDFTAQ